MVRLLAKLTQKRMAELFGVSVPAISKHLDNIYTDGELERRATISILETVQKEGARNVSRNIEYYNLDAVISPGSHAPAWEPIPCSINILQYALPRRSVGTRKVI